MSLLPLARLAPAALLAAACTRPVGEAKGNARGDGRMAGGGAPRELVLERALPLEIQEDFEPSGLLLAHGKLLTVSDKDDDVVFELLLGAEGVEVRPFLRFDPPPEEPRPFDFEGLTAGANGALWLVSEARYRVLSLTPDGHASWISPSVQPIGVEAGLFRKRNAALEGITALRDGHVLLAAEREPRGLIELVGPGQLRGATAFTMSQSAYPAPSGRSLDFSDLTSVDDSVFVLERNAHLIVRLERAENRWLEREAWSYAETEADPRFAYQDRSFGLAEGLALSEDHVFVVLDNNRDQRSNGKGDARPLLFVFERPR